MNNMIERRPIFLLLLELAPPLTTPNTDKTLPAAQRKERLREKEKRSKNLVFFSFSYSLFTSNPEVKWHKVGPFKSLLIRELLNSF
jgi:hypothetical protein